MASRADHFSKLILGSEKRLRVLATIARVADSDCYPTKVAEMSGAPANAVSQLMSKLVDAGLLEPIDPERGEILKRHRKSESVLWQWSDEQLLELDGGQ